MSSYNVWLDRLLDEGASPQVLREFKVLYSEIMFGIATNDGFSRDEIFDVIKSMGDSDADAINAKMYLAYVIGKFQSTDAYAGVIANYIDDIGVDTADKIMEEAVGLILER